MKKEIHYHDYLELDTVLNSQKPLSTSHDESLFIITHQCYELWFKQIHHDLDSITKIFSKNSVPEKELAIIITRVQRIIKIKELFLQQLSILETMDALSFLEFRSLLGSASGFQSLQFRELELKLGISLENNPIGQSEFYYTALKKFGIDRLKQLKNQPNLFQLLESWLERMPFMEVDQFHFWQEYQKNVNELHVEEKEKIENSNLMSEEEKNKMLEFMQTKFDQFKCLFDDSQYEKLKKEKNKKLSRPATLAALFIILYQEHPLLQLPYRLISALMDLDEHLSTWRYRHSLMAHRMIGSRVGTGGSTGHVYLTNATISRRAFVDLFDLISYLIPKDKIAKLPKALSEQLDFCYSSGKK